MPIIALCNLKGGTGKTTSTVFLATALHRQGSPVRVYDADPQGSATEWFQRAEDDGTPLPFDVLPANARTLSRLPQVSSETWTIIDCPPGDTQIIDAAIKAADRIIVPVSPSGVEVERMWTTTELAGQVPVSVLLTSTIANTKSLESLRDALIDEGVPVFTVAIPQREAIKATYGQLPTGDLYGYAAIVNELQELM